MYNKEKILFKHYLLFSITNKNKLTPRETYFLESVTVEQMVIAKRYRTEHQHKTTFLCWLAKRKIIYWGGNEHYNGGIIMVYSTNLQNVYLSAKISKQNGTQVPDV